MTKIIRSDIELAKTSNARDLISKDASEATNLKAAIRSFIDESLSNNKLTGDVWDLTRGRLEQCCEALDKRISASEALLSGIDAANNKMETYLNLDPSGDEFDDAELPTLREELSQAKANKSTAEAQLAKERAGHVETDPKTGKTTTVVDEAEVARLEAEIAKLNALIEKLEKIIKKLELLVPYDEEATGALNNSYASAKLAYSTSINQLKNM